MSCSAQGPKAATEGSVSRVSLSRPAPAMTPMMAPSHAPPLSPSTGELQPSQLWAIVEARSKSFAASTPSRTAGTIPKCDSAE